MTQKKKTLMGRHSLSWNFAWSWLIFEFWKMEAYPVLHFIYDHSLKTLPNLIFSRFAYIKSSINLSHVNWTLQLNSDLRYLIIGLPWRVFHYSTTYMKKRCQVHFVIFLDANSVVMVTITHYVNRVALERRIC